MNQIQKEVKEFMVAAGQHPSEKPIIPNEETRKLHATLIFEECVETLNAMGFSLNEVQGEIQLVSDKEPDIVETLDGLVDLQYVLTGAANRWGLPLDEGHEEVHKTNMAKFGPGGYRREDGKWMKPPNWVAPNLEKIIQQKQNEFAALN